MYLKILALIATLLFLLWGEKRRKSTFSERYQHRLYEAKEDDFVLHLHSNFYYKNFWILVIFVLNIFNLLAGFNDDRDWFYPSLFLCIFLYYGVVVVIDFYKEKTMTPDRIIYSSKYVQFLGDNKVYMNIETIDSIQHNTITKKIHIRDCYNQKIKFRVKDVTHEQLMHFIGFVKKHTKEEHFYLSRDLK